jgi:cysteine desulfurase
MRIGSTIYLDHQASTPVDARVIEKMMPYNRDIFANPHSSGHVLGWQAASAIDEAAFAVAQLLGCDQNEITFTSGATEANNLALLGFSKFHLSGKRRRLLVTTIEHKCVLEAAYYLRDHHGYSLDEIPVDTLGFVDLEALRDLLADDVLLVSIGVVNSEIGTIQPISEIANIVHEFGAVLHCDAAQAPLALGVDNISEAADMVSLSAHKIYGPKGVGALFIRRELRAQIEPLIFGGGQQDGLRSGTLPTPLCVGFGCAAEILQIPDTIQRIGEMQERRNKFVECLLKSPYVAMLNGPAREERHPGNANIRFLDIDARQLLGMLQPKIAASMGSACASGIPEPSYVLRSIGLSNGEAYSSIRFSLGLGTTDEDVTNAIDIIVGALSRIEEDEPVRKAF